MNRVSFTIIFIGIALAATLFDGLASTASTISQYPLDPQETEAFHDYVDSLRTSKTSAFVGRCRGPTAGEEAILVVPVGSSSDVWLELLYLHQVYTGASYKIQDGQFVMTELGQGGNWTYQLLQSFLVYLSKKSFRLVPPKELGSVLSGRPSDTCAVTNPAGLPQ